MTNFTVHVCDACKRQFRLSYGLLMVGYLHACSRECAAIVAQTMWDDAINEGELDTSRQVAFK